MPHEATDRRTVLRAAGVLGVGMAGVGSVAACGSSARGESAAPGAQAGGTSATSSAGTVVKVADVPVGGGIVLADQLVVVTQPTPGEFKAFSAMCTHKQCAVSKVESGQIVCSCHGSHFDITTGAPTAESPAKAPLGSRTATVSGGTVTIT